MAKKTQNIRNKIKEVAESALISATDEFCEKVEEELEKAITPDFLDKIRTEMVKKAKTTAQNPPAPKA